jgi:DNA gyrase/topoisomerase IV subunit B
MFSVQGKIPNALRSTARKVAAHDTCAALFNALGTVPGATCDLADARFERVIICSDGDADGIHIQALVTIMFLRLLRPWVEANRVFAVRPPLFRFEAEGREPMYAYTPAQRATLAERYEAAGVANPTVTRFRGLAMLEPDELRQHCLDAADRRLLPVTITSAEATAATLERYLSV